MNRFVIMVLGAVAVLAAIIGLIVLVKKAAAPDNGKIAPSKTTNKTMTIASPSFQHNAVIPKQFTCEGENTNPELRFADIPENAKSLALIMDDPDAPKGTFTHWLLWNIAPKTSAIAENAVPAGAFQGKNGAGKSGYTGPCPPPGKPHRYFFKLYALDALLALPAGADKNSLESEINSHLLAKAEFIGMYQR